MSDDDDAKSFIPLCTVSLNNGGMSGKVRSHLIFKHLRSTTSVFAVIRNTVFPKEKAKDERILAAATARMKTYT